MAEGKVIIVNPDMFGKDPDSKTTKANEVSKSFGLSDAALAEVEDFKAQLTKHNAWDLPFMGYVNEDGYGYAYVPGAAVVYDPYWDAHQAFLALPKDVQDRIRHSYAVHAPSGRPLWRQHVPALPAWLQREVRGYRREPVLIGTDYQPSFSDCPIRGV